MSSKESQAVTCKSLAAHASAEKNPAAGKLLADAENGVESRQDSMIQDEQALRSRTVFRKISAVKARGFAVVTAPVAQAGSPR